MSKVEDKVCEELDWYCHNERVGLLAKLELNERADEGFRKYGVTLERTDLTKEQWFQHLKEELLDACNYATRLEMYEELTYVEKDILEVLKRDLFHSLEGIYENSLS
jgi:hypothetical protein